MLDELNKTRSSPLPDRPSIYETEHEDFRSTCRAFMEKEVVPHHDQWERDGQVSREVWLKAGEAGLLCFDVDEEYGGAGMKDFRFNMVLIEEITRAGASGLGFPVHNDVIVPYISHLATPEQKQRWLPGLVSGELISAIAMTEPGAGSDLQGIRTSAVDKGDHYVLNGSKTFISNGIMSDLVIVVARTEPGRRPPGHQPDRGRARHGGLRARPQPREGRPQGPGHRRAVLRQRRWCPRRTCSARRAPASSR